MTERLGAMPVEGGIRPRYSWSVWSDNVQHRVDAEINLLTGSVRVDADGVQAEWGARY